MLRNKLLTRTADSRTKACAYDTMQNVVIRNVLLDAMMQPRCAAARACVQAVKAPITWRCARVPGSWAIVVN